MFLRAHRLAVAALVVFGGGLGGCAGCESTPPTGNGRPSITVRFPEGNTLQADGVSRLRFTLKAQDGKGGADTSALTVEAPSGLLALADGEFVAGNTLVNAPAEDGSLDLDYQCTPNTAGDVALTVTNASADVKVNISCVEPAGPIIITVTDDSPECRNLQADGENDCEVFLSITQRAGDVNLARSGTAVIRVVETNPVDGDRSVLSNLTGGPRAEEINVPIAVADANAEAGVGSFFIGAPADPETLTYTVSFEGTTITRDFIIDPFENSSSIVIDGATNAVGGTPAVINITVTGANGLPAADQSVTVSVAGGDDDATVEAAGAPAAAAITATLDADGKVSATVNTPVVTEATIYTVTVSFTFLQSKPPLTATFAIEAREQDALILNLTADPPAVRSDIASERTTALGVRFTRDGNAVTGGGVTLRIRGSDQARIEFIPQNANDTAAEVILDDTDFDASGNAIVEVTAVPNVAPGAASITAVGTDNDPVSRDEVEEIVIAVERAPILQSIVAQPVDPSTIGVRGGSLRSTVPVRFELRDDRDRPMAGVPVTFATNVTADRGVSVTASDVSDIDGFVQTILAAGTIAGPVSVVVTATPASPDPSVVLAPLTVESQPIAIVGGLPNFLASFMACSGAIANREGEEYTCAVTLVDRFSNVASDQTVQFRAEGSGSSPVGRSDASGVAGATLTLDDGDLVSGASVPSWSYGFVPLPGSVVATAFPGCFDATLTTGCDLLQLCASHPADCPLEPGCLADAQDAEVALGIQAGFATLGVRDVGIDDYVAKHRSCGFPVACLTGVQTAVDGVLDLPGDECDVSLGCMDYSSRTECPHDGLVSVIASTRGEESFSDGNGNGIFDFEDDNNNNLHDFGEPLTTRTERCLGGVCELNISQSCTVDTDCTGRVALDAFVDLPEPFLDKNDSCSYDDYTNVPRFRFTPSERARHTDLFSDVDDSSTFGFVEGSGGLLETNGHYDSDTETFLSAHMLTVGAPRFIVGTPCTPGTANCIENVTPEGVIGINPTGVPAALAANGSIELVYRWADGNGNCPSPGFALLSATSSTGPVKTFGDLDLTLNDVNCGFLTGTNRIKPFCEDIPFLGAPVGRVLVKANCENEVAPKQAEITWGLGTESGSVTFLVNCGI